MRRKSLIVGALVVTLTGCAGSGGSDAPSPSPTTEPSASSPPTSSPPAQTEITWSGPEVVDDASTVPLSATAVAGPGGFVAQRASRSVWEAGPTTGLYYSPDGQSWEQTLELAGVEVNAVLAGGPGYVAVGTRYLPTGFADLNLAPWAAWSADGQTWESVAVNLPDQATPGVAGTALAPLVVGEPRFVPTTAGISISGNWLSALIATDDGLVALGHSQQAGRNNILWTSADGKAWSALDEDPFGPDASVDGLAAGGGRYVAYGHRQTEGDFPGSVLTWYSDDALAWEAAAGDASFEDEYGAGPFVAGVVPFGDGFVMVGGGWLDPPMAWASADGSEWAEPAQLPSLADMSAEIRAVAASPALLVAVGREVVTGEGLDPGEQFPGLWTSTDGAQWSQVSTDELRGDRTEAGIGIDSVAWTGDQWLALGKVWDYPDEVATAVAWTGR